MKLLIVAIGLLFVSGLGHAEEFSVLQPAKSGITFVSKQMGVPITGKFNKYTAQVSFDPNKPETGTAVVVIDMASTDAGNEDSNSEVTGKGWFNVKEFPTSKFESTGFKAAGAGRFEAAGKMTIKGVSRSVVVPFSVKNEAGMMVIEGSIPVLRHQYGVGTADWAEMVADEVPILFRFYLGVSKK